jgi:lysophospholipase L1-like esterase
LLITAACAQAQDVASGPANLLKGCDFAGDAKGWNGLGDDEKKSVSLVELPGGKKGLCLCRKAAGVDVGIDQAVPLAPQTLYKCSITGFGKAQVSIRLRPACSKDDEFETLFKPWAVTSAPLVASDEPRTTEFIFDSGLKADRTAVKVYLPDAKDLGSYTITTISLRQAGSSKPDPDETVILHLGDSITASIYLPFEQRVDAALAPMLAKGFPARKIRQINLGADGEYIKDLLDSGRYKKVVKENYQRVDVAIIRYGANDTRFGAAEDFKKQLASLCDALRSDYPGIKILLGTGPYLKGTQAQYGQYWQAIRDLAADRKFGLVDIYARMEKSQSDKLTLGPGNMHPSRDGVQLMAEEIFAALNAALASTSPAPATLPAPGATLPTSPATSTAPAR